MRKRFFLIPAIFFLVVGSGNALVGRHKEDQYRQVITELSQFRSLRQDNSSFSPLKRLEHEKEVTTRVKTRIEKAESRRELYHLFFLGGLMLLMISALLFSAAIVAFIAENFRNERNDKTS
ncbi:MAG: hypothetical protein PHC51_06320 [bacterium]|nr:hypothetical protein [bacterium]